MKNLETAPDNFGIEKTMDVDFNTAGNQDLLNDLMAPETAAASPDDVKSIDDGDDNKNLSDEEKAELAKKVKANENVDDDTASNPDALTDFLTSDDDDEDKSTDDDDEEDKNKAPENTSDDDDDDDDKNKAPEAGDDKDADGGEESNIAFDALAEELFSLGVFNKIENEEDIKIENPEDFLERFKLEQQRGANMMIDNFISQFGEDYQNAFQAIYINGVTPQDYFTQQAKVESFKNLDMTKENNQEAVVKRALQDQGYENEDIESEVERIKNYGDLEDVSKKHHKVLVKHEEQLLKTKAEEAKQAQAIKQAQKEEYVTNVRATLTEKLKTKEFDGIPLNVKTANELQDFLLVDKWKTESGETLTDFDKTILELKRPENHATKVKVALLLKLIASDPTLSTIQKSAVSKQSSELFRTVAKQKTTAKRAESNKRQPAPSWFRKT